MSSQTRFGYQKRCRMNETCSVQPFLLPWTAEIKVAAEINDYAIF
jgi:hypothetical protein